MRTQAGLLTVLLLVVVLGIVSGLVTPSEGAAPRLAAWGGATVGGGEPAFSQRVYLPLVARNMVAVAATATPSLTPCRTPTASRTPTHRVTPTASRTPTPTVMPGPTSAAPQCWRDDPTERNVTRVIGSNLSLFAQATDGDCDIYYIECYYNGVRVYQYSHKDSLCMLRVVFWQQRVDRGPNTWKIQYADRAGNECSVDWVVTGIEPSPTPTLTLTPAPQVRITALQYLGSDEYVQVTNQGTQQQDLTGWKISNMVSGQVYTFPFLILGAGAYVRVHSGPSAVNNPPIHLLWTTAYIWSDTSGRANLLDSNNQVISSWRYP